MIHAFLRRFSDMLFHYRLMRLGLTFLIFSMLRIAALPDSIALFYALDADLQGFKSQAQELGQPISVGSRTIHRLGLGPHKIYAVRMGSGSVETAASVQAVLTRFRFDWAFSIGPAGALSETLPTGTWHRVSEVLAWQKGTAGLTGYRPAESSSWKLDWNRLPLTNLPPALQSTASVVIASGEMFIASQAERERIHVQTQADAVDMNTFGLAVVCKDHGVPLFAWRIISDLADEAATETFRAFLGAYKGEGGTFIAELVSRLPPNPASPASYPTLRNLIEQP